MKPLRQLSPNSLYLDNEEKGDDASEQNSSLSKELVAGCAQPFGCQVVSSYGTSGKLIWHDCAFYGTQHLGD
jgi:hypothetical protein